MLQAINRKTALLLLLSSLFSSKLFAQPVNNLCSNATSLTPTLTCVNTGGTLYQAGNESVLASLCGTTYDVWYSFTTPANVTSVNIDLAPIAAGGNDITSTNTFIEAFSGSACSPVLLGACTPQGTTLTLTALSGSTTYYFRVFANITPTSSSGKWDYNICVTYNPPPTNDDCSGAITLSNGIANNSGTVWLASGSTGIPSGCATGNPDDDVWYSYTAPGTSVTIDLAGIGTNLNTSGARMQLFSGSCGALTSVACGTTSLTSAVTNGSTYYIRIYSFGTGSIGGTASGSAFSITASTPTPPANDNCSGAITLSNGVTNSTGTVWLATASTGIPVGCATGDPDDDVWYRYTSTGTNLTVALSAVGSNLNTSGARMQLFSGTCGALTSLACGTTSITSAVTNGTTYYIRVYSFGTGSIGGISTGSVFSITATATTPPQTNFVAGRMNEVFKQTILSPANVLNDPWEITYGSDNYLWITEAKGYKVYRMDPVTGVKITVLDISQGASGYLTGPEHTAFNVQFASTQNPWPQGGMAGLALHPKFLDPVTPKNYVYVSYVRTYNGGSSPSGVFFTNNVVRFTYNVGTEKLESPVALCDTLPGSNDHNSQRIIITPVGGTDYLFYASGDMGSGQFGNRMRPQKSQNPDSYEGKILRFNLESDGDGGLEAWIPNDNPYAATSAVWSIGMRNNQGFAYDPVLDILYGTSHGPFSDDELNIIERRRNYGHPLVIGFAADGNYDGNSVAGTTSSISAGAPYTDNTGISTNPPIADEMANKAVMDANGNGLYKDPLFSAYAAPLGTLNPPNSPVTKTIGYIWRWNPSNGGAGGGWPSEAWSGLDLYSHKLIPGWHKSLVAASLKWGRLVRLRLDQTGIATAPNNNASDTISYFGSTNRFRDLAFAPGGKDLFVIMDKSSTTSGPSAGNPVVPACGGCVQKYTFLGYADNGGKSSIPTSIDVTDGTVNQCNDGTTITIDDDNNNLWVPITGPDGNIMAEINANGQNLGIITSSFYKNSGAIRTKNGVHYLDRNLTITPQTQPSTPVKIRLYMSKAEFDALDADPLSGITSINDLKILKNSDPCNSTISAATTLITPAFYEAHGANGYMLQATISGFSSFYFSSSNITLPLDLITFTGSLKNSTTTLLKWKTENEINVSHFVVERSINGINFSSIGSVAASNIRTIQEYSFEDNEVANQQSLIVYYRLIMVDINGEYKYSKIISVSLADITGKVTVMPNPVTDETKITLSAPQDGMITYKIVNNAGRTILQNSLYGKKGNISTVTVDLAKYPAGVYYLKVTGAGIDTSLKLQKL